MILIQITLTVIHNDSGNKHAYIHKVKCSNKLDYQLVGSLLLSTKPPSPQHSGITLSPAVHQTIAFNNVD